MRLEEKAPYLGATWVSHLQQDGAAALLEVWKLLTGRRPFTAPLVIAR